MKKLIIYIGVLIGLCSCSGSYVLVREYNEVVEAYFNHDTTFPRCDSFPHSLPQKKQFNTADIFWVLTKTKKLIHQFEELNDSRQVIQS